MSDETKNVGAINLKPFCGGDFSARYDMGEPFVLNGFRYATDGKVAVRISAADEPNTDSSTPSPMGTLPWPKSPPTEMLPWPAPVYVWELQESPGDIDEDGDARYVWMPSAEWQEIANRFIGCTLHYVISNLPNVRFCPAGGEMDAIYFKFDGGDGLVMPMRKDLCVAMKRVAKATGK